MYLSSSFHKLLVKPIDDFLITNSPIWSIDTFSPFESTISALIPGMGALKDPTLNGLCKQQCKIDPETSVPPAEFMIGTFDFPMNSNNHFHGFSVQGSPPVQTILKELKSKSSNFFLSLII